MWEHEIGVRHTRPCYSIGRDKKTALIYEEWRAYITSFSRFGTLGYTTGRSKNLFLEAAFQLLESAFSRVDECCSRTVSSSRLR